MSWMNAPRIEQWCYEETLRMNERGLPMDIPLAKKTIRFLEQYTRKRIEECKAITDGISPTQVGGLLDWLNVMGGVPVPNLQRFTLEHAIKNFDMDDEVRKVIDIRLEMGRVSTKKLYKMLEMNSGDAVARGSFIYHGAGPGRFTARRLQPHNFQRPTIKNVDHVIQLLENENFDLIVEEFGDRTLEAVGSCMRGFFKAPDGMTIVRGDYNAIEARVLAWFAGQDDATLLFHEGKDIYCDMAGYIFNEDPVTIRKGHLKEDLKYSDQRKLGKDTVLGCGYNMGVATFLAQAETKGEDSVNGIKIRTDDKNRGKRDRDSFNPEAWRLASDAVYGYRRKYDRINKLWATVENAAKRAIKSHKVANLYVVNKLVKFRMEGDSLVVYLPSGRSIYYPKCEIYERDNKYTGAREEAIRFRSVLESGKVVWETLYGGKIVENVVQAISRDLLVYGMYNISKKGFILIGTVHDEIITLLSLSKVKELSDVLKYFEKVICRLPSWAKGETKATTIPLMAEAKIGVRYGK